MKKQLLLVGSLAILMASCGTQTAEKVQEEVKVYSTADLLSGAEALVDDTVWFSGNVKKVCCSKKKMMVADEADSTVAPLRVLAGGDVDTLSKDLKGAKVKVQGVFRLNKIAKGDLESQLASVDSLIATAKDGVAEKEVEHKEKGCHNGGLEQRKKAIEEKIQWLNDNGKDFVADYYVETVKLGEVCKQNASGEKASCCSGK